MGLCGFGFFLSMGVELHRQLKYKDRKYLMAYLFEGTSHASADGSFQQYHIIT
jgi:hypothetical protein